MAVVAVSFVYVIVGKDLRHPDQPDRMALAQPAPELDILMGEVGLRPHLRHRLYQITPVQGISGIDTMVRIKDLLDHPVWRVMAAAAIGSSGIRMRFGRRDEPLKMRGPPGIIIIDVGDVGAARQKPANVARAGWMSAVNRQTDVVDTRIGESVDDLPPMVGRRIVDNEQVPIGVGLRDHRTDRPRQEFCPVIGRQDDRDQQFLGIPSQRRQSLPFPIRAFGTSKA